MQLKVEKMAWKCLFWGGKVLSWRLSCHVHCPVQLTVLFCVLSCPFHCPVLLTSLSCILSCPFDSPVLLTVLYCQLSWPLSCLLSCPVNCTVHCPVNCPVNCPVLCPVLCPVDCPFLFTVLSYGYPMHSSPLDCPDLSTVVSCQLPCPADCPVLSTVLSCWLSCPVYCPIPFDCSVLLTVLSCVLFCPVDCPVLCTVLSFWLSCPVDCPLGGSDFVFFSQIWWSPPQGVFLRLQGMRIWRKKVFGFSQLLCNLLHFFQKATFLLNFQTFITNARMNGFFSKFPRLSFGTFFNTSKKFALYLENCSHQRYFKICVQIIK